MMRVATPTGPSSAATHAGIEAVYRERYPDFVRVCRAILGEREAARDAVQDGFARALRNRAAYTGRGSLDGWLWHIVVNAARDRRRIRPATPPAAPSDPDPAPDGDPDVRALVARLPERQRLVLFLRYYADLDYAGIAEALDISPGTVGATLHSAHAALRALVQEEMP